MSQQFTGMVPTGMAPTGTLPTGTQSAVPVTRMMQVKTAVVANKWKSLSGFLIVVGIVVVLCLIFIPGAPIHKLIWSSSTVTVLVPANDPKQAPVPSSEPSMRKDINYNSVVNSYKLDTGFGDNRNTAIVIVGNFMGEQQVGGGVSPQSFNDAKLYRILTAATVDAAKQAVVS